MASPTRSRRRCSDMQCHFLPVWQMNDEEIVALTAGGHTLWVKRMVMAMPPTGAAPKALT